MPVVRTNISTIVGWNTTAIDYDGENDEPDNGGNLDQTQDELD